MAIKKNVIKTNIGSYVHYIRGVKKSGKSTLFRDLVLLENNQDETKGLLISFGDEDGYKSLDKLQYEAVESWDMNENERGERGFVQLVDDLVANNEEYGINMVCYDTIDKLIDIATKEVLKLSARETGKPCKSLNDAFGGYARGKERLSKIIQEQTARLKKIGLNPIVLGHTKYKDKTDEISGMEYSQLTSSLNSDLDAIFGDTAQMVTTISVDKIIEENRIVGTQRIMHFRDDGLVDSGSRFPGLPEKAELSAQNYIDAFNQGVKSAYLTPVTDKEMVKIKQAEVKDNEESVKFHREQLKKGTDNEELTVAIDSLKVAIKDVLSKKQATVKEIKEILSPYGQPTDIDNLSSAYEILEKVTNLSK